MELLRLTSEELLWKKKPVSLASVKPPYNLFVDQKFILTVHGPKFDKLDDDRKAIALFDELLRINDFENGTLKSYSVVGNYETLSTWGIDWLEAESVPTVFDESKKLVNVNK